MVTMRNAQPEPVMWHGVNIHTPTSQIPACSLGRLPDDVIRAIQTNRKSNKGILRMLSTKIEFCA